MSPQLPLSTCVKRPLKPFKMASYSTLKVRFLRTHHFLARHVWRTRARGCLRARFAGSEPDSDLSSGSRWRSRTGCQLALDPLYSLGRPHFYPQLAKTIYIAWNLDQLIPISYRHELCRCCALASRAQAWVR